MKLLKYIIPFFVAIVIFWGYSLPAITPEEEEAIKYMREEEKLARDIYQTFQDKYDMNVFRNISEAEQMHMEHVKVLITKYGITDPVISDTRGSFSNKFLEETYIRLINQGNISRLEAIKAGLLIEELDIKDLKEKMSGTKETDILNVYQWLLNGSENHLRAFYRNLNREGVDYTPQHLDKDDFDKIVSSNKNGMKKNGMGRGNGNRNGMGNCVNDCRRINCYNK